MILYIIRHGETEWNKVKRMQGQTDIPLAEEGIRLAKITGENMRRLPMDFIISSPLTRARQTAELVRGERDIPILLDRRIIEISFGDWEGEQILESQKLHPDFREQFYHDPMHCMRPPNGETFPDVCKRTADFYQSLRKTPEYENAKILISTHGAAGRCLLANFYDDKEDIWRGGVPANCSVCILEVKDGKETILEKDKIFYEI